MGFSYLAFSHWSAPTTTWMSLALVPGIQPSTTYQIQVMVKVNGVWGGFGPACNVTTPAFALKTDLAGTPQAAVAEQLEPSALKLYPNPAIGPINIQADGLDGTSATLECVDMMGRVVHRESVAVANGLVQHRLQAAEGWAAGTNIIRLQTEQQLHIGRVELRHL